MPQIQWAINSYQARALPLSAQQIVNLYAEAAPQDAKSPVVLYGTPGIKSFCDTVGDGPIRGMEVMDGVLYALSGDVLYSVDAACKRTALGSIGVGADSTSTVIAGATVSATATFEITGGSSGTISSVTVGGEELLGGPITWITSNEDTAALFLTTSVLSNPNVESITEQEENGLPGPTEITINKPGFTVEGDLLVATVSSTATSGAGLALVITPPAGWTEIFFEPAESSDPPPGNGFVIGQWFKIAGDSEPVDYTFTHGDAQLILLAQMYRITGHHATIPIHAHEVEVNNLADDQMPGVVTTLDNTLILGTFDVYGTILTHVTITGWARGQNTNATQSGNDLQILGYYRDHDTAGDVGDTFVVATITSTAQLGSMTAISPKIAGLLANSEYEFTVEENVVTITAADSTGADQNGLAVIVTVTGDVTVDAEVTMTDGITMPAIIVSTGGAGVPLTNPACVSMSHNQASPSQLVIVDGTNGWIFDTTNGLRQIIDTDFFSADVVDFQDQYFIFIRKDTGQFFLSNLNAGTVYTATDIATAEGDPDNLVTLISNRRELWLFGAETIEIWYNSGGSDFPFTRFEGGFIERGCAAAFSIAEDDNSLFWLGEDRIFYRADGYTPQRISQHGIEEALRKYQIVDDACAFIYTMAGHKFYVCTFPAEDHTWVYDITTGLWHERQSFGMSRWRVSTYVEAYGKHLVGDFQDGKIGELDLDTYDEYGSTMQGIATGPSVYDDRQRIFHHRFELDIEAGVGLTSGQGSDPQVWLDWADDGGHTFSERKPFRSMGKIGAYLQRLRWLCLGQSRQRIYRLIVSDPVKRSIVAAHLTAAPGDH